MAQSRPAFVNCSMSRNRRVVTCGEVQQLSLQLSQSATSWFTCSSSIALVSVLGVLGRALTYSFLCCARASQASILSLPVISKPHQFASSFTFGFPKRDPVTAGFLGSVHRFVRFFEKNFGITTINGTACHTYTHRYRPF